MPLTKRTEIAVRQRRKNGTSVRELLERDKEVCKKARASTKPFGWVTSEEFDRHTDNTPILGNLARDANTSGGDLIHVAIPSDREANSVAKGQGPTSFPFTCKVASASVENCYCGSVKQVLPLVIICCTTNPCRIMEGKNSPGKEI